MLQELGSSTSTQILPILISRSVLTAIFPGEPGLAVFIGAKDDGSSGDNWSCKKCKAPVRSTTNKPTSGCPSCHPTNSVGALKGIPINACKSNFNSRPSMHRFIPVPHLSPQKILPFPIVWLGGRVVRTLDLRSTGHGFKSQPPRCRVQPWANC